MMDYYKRRAVGRQRIREIMKNATDRYIIYLKIGDELGLSKKFVDEYLEQLHKSGVEHGL